MNLIMRGTLKNKHKALMNADGYRLDAKSLLSHSSEVIHLTTIIPLVLTRESYCLSHPWHLGPNVRVQDQGGFQQREGTKTSEMYHWQCLVLSVKGTELITVFSTFMLAAILQNMHLLKDGAILASLFCLYFNAIVLRLVLFLSSQSSFFF